MMLQIKSYHNDQSTGEVQVELTGNETWSDLADRFQGKVIVCMNALHLGLAVNGSRIYWWSRISLIRVAR
jgi:3-keto-L-gulonate-6-phosphate decarboxylase